MGHCGLQDVRASEPNERVGGATWGTSLVARSRFGTCPIGSNSRTHGFQKMIDDGAFAVTALFLKCIRHFERVLCLRLDLFGRTVLGKPSPATGNRLAQHWLAAGQADADPHS